MGLRSYVEDEEVKYKADHELAGLENDNRLMKTILDKPCIPHSLRIRGEWCHIIQNNQQPVCIQCNELEHTKRNCPKIYCRVCKLLVYMSYNCDQQEIKMMKCLIHRQGQMINRQKTLIKRAAGGWRK